ncbi:hypothetical protein BKA82DRAFT_157251, partial [Pisolithus tinctorius]
TAMKFMWDCMGDRDSFNCEAISVFTDDFIDKVMTHGWYTSSQIPQCYLTFGVVSDAFKTHFTYIKTHYREVVVAQQRDPMKAKVGQNLKLQKLACLSRKGCLLKSHLKAVVDHPTLQKHICLVEYLGTQGVSSDASEDEHTRTIDYPHVCPQWRSLTLAMIMWQADEVIEENAKIPIGKQKKSGTQLHNRPHSNKFNNNAAAPPGLPCNCDDVKWLASLPSRTLKCLRI